MANRPQRSARQRASIRLLAAGAGIVAGLGTLSLVWPLQDRSAKEDGRPNADALGERPNRILNVLLIGSDADRPGTISNGAAPAGPANSDALLLVHIDPDGPVQVMNLPVEAAVRLPGDATPVPSEASTGAAVRPWWPARAPSCSGSRRGSPSVTSC